MLAFLMFVLVCLSPPDQVATRPVISPTAFRAWFDAALSGRLSIPAEVSRTRGDIVTSS